MVSILIKKSPLSGIIRCPSSKSYTHRGIAIASLAHGGSTIKNALLARDTLATISACEAFGVDIQRENDDLYIQGTTDLSVPDNIINAENSGTTMRFVAAMSSLVEKGFTILTGDESLRNRPMQPLLNALKQLGVQCYSSKVDGTAPLIVKGGGIEGGTAVIDGQVSSQFISALLISGIYGNSEITIKIMGKQVSRPYIEATLATMEKFRAKVKHDGSFLEYHLSPGSYTGTTFEIPSDFSTAALIIAAGILAGGELIIEGLSFKLPQGDSLILEIIRQMGGRIRVDHKRGQALVYGSEGLEGGSFDLSDNPDLLPVLSILALKARSPVHIHGIMHARLKETDRVAKIARELPKLGAIVKESPDHLIITPPKLIRSATLEAYNDHRLFMAFTIASMLTEGSTVSGAESVDVSYPGFINEMIRLGARVVSMPDRE